MLEALLQAHGDKFLGALTGAGGLDSEEAKNLLPPALGGIGEALSGGGFDLGSLLGEGGGVSDLLSQLDIPGIASSAGIEQGKAQTGLASLIPVVVALLGDKASGAGGVEDLLGMLGGGGESGGAGAIGALGGLAGKLFGK